MGPRTAFWVKIPDLPKTWFAGYALQKYKALKERTHKIVFLAPDFKNTYFLFAKELSNNIYTA